MVTTMPDRKYDYPKLKEEFITSPGLTIRELARRHNIEQDKVSSLHAQARKPDERGLTWYDLQQLSIVKSDDASIEAAAKAAAKRTEKAQKVVDKLITAIGKAADQFIDTVGESNVSAKDLALLSREISPLIRLIGEGSTLPAKRDDDRDHDLRIPVPDGGPFAVLFGRIAQASGAAAGDAGREGTRSLPAPIPVGEVIES